MILGKFARLSLAIAATVASATAPAHAGGVIGWATAVNDFSTAGTAVGAAAVVLGILAVGAILMFGITGLITTVVMVCLGGALMAKAQTVGQSLFGAAGGGSIHHVRVAASPGVVPAAVTLPGPRF
jgi:type IV secretory pathway VirB2 component (pilin)